MNRALIKKFGLLYQINFICNSTNINQMKRQFFLKIFIVFILLIPKFVICQSVNRLYKNIDLSLFTKESKSNVWLELTEDALGNSQKIPVLVLKGASPGPVLGITAAIHGNEVNGTAIIHQLTDLIDLKNLNGVILAFPVLNPQGYQLSQRDDMTDEDLNRIFPGKINGTESEQLVWAIKEKVLPPIDFLIDIHTASFGRVNSMYVRANLKNDTLAKMAILLQPDIILDSREASAGIITSASKTLRQEAEERGVYCVTLEAGDPQIIQSDMVKRGSQGIYNILAYLSMVKSPAKKITDKAKYCNRSWWIYTDKGGFLNVTVGVNQRVKKGEVIAELYDVFGSEIKKYTCPEDGIVIGKSTNPVAASGARIIQLGIER